MTEKPDTYSVEGFCKKFHISRSMFYKLVREDKGPKLMKIGRRTLITAQSTQEWQEKMQAFSR